MDESRHYKQKAVLYAQAGGSAGKRAVISKENVLLSMAVSAGKTLRLPMPITRLQSGDLL